MFSGIDNKEVKIPDFSSPAPYNTENLGLLYKVEPVMDSNSLTIVWFLPYVETHFSTKPLLYHSHILGHEGKGSLLSNLIKDGLATSTGTYVDHILKSYTNFYLDVQLTEKGVKQYEEVLRRVWAYIKMVKDEQPQKYIFEDYQTTSQLQWNFLEKSGYSYYTTWLASRMQLFGPENVQDVIATAHLVDEFDPNHVDELSNLLYDHNNCNIYFTTQANKGKTDRKEKWYGTNFSKEKLSEDLLSELYSGSKENLSDMSLPAKNKYLPQNLDLLSPNEEWSKEPIKVKDSSDSVIWYKKDDKFGQPKCQITLRIYKKKNHLLDDSDPLKQAYNDIWTDVYDELLR